MDALKLITERQSCRAFKPDPVPEETLKKILEAAGNSPSAINSQPWEVAVVSGNKKNELAAMLFELAQSKAPTSPDIPKPASWPKEIEARIRDHFESRQKVLGLENDTDKEKMFLKNFEFYGAPCAVFLYMDGSLGHWSIYDLGLYTQNLLLAAQALGVSSVIQASVTDYAADIKDFLGLPEDKKLLFCIALGYSDTEAIRNKYRSVKKKPEEYITWYK